MKMSIFLPLTAIGSFIWNVVLIYLGRVAGEAWHNKDDFITELSSIVLLMGTNL